MICTFYSSNAGYDEVIQVLKTVLPKAKINTSEEHGMKKIQTSSGGMFSSKSGLKLSYRERIDFNATIESAAANCGLSKNLTGLYNYVSNFPSQNPKIRELLMMKVRTVKSEFSLMQEKGTTSNIEELVKALAQKFDSVIFAQPSTPISKAAGQHFLNENLELILDSNGYSEVNDLGPAVEKIYQEREQAYQEQVLNKLSPNQKERKLNNEQSLRQIGIQVNKFLPAIEDDEHINLRTEEEIAQRVTMLSLINVFASGHITNEQLINTLKSKELWKFATAKEKDLMENPTDEKKSYETWKCEGIWTLLWALKKVDDLGNPANMCDLGNVSQDQYPLHDPIGFLNGNHELRSKKEIVDANDFYYRMNWACVNARVKGQLMTTVNPGVVYERHYALNWLIKYMDQEWDNVSTDT